MRLATPDDLSELHAIASRAVHGLRISRPTRTSRMRAATVARVYEVEPELVLAGFRRFEAMCTSTGEALLRSMGYAVVAREETPLDGRVTAGVALLRKERL
jgi:hypothetical protein